MVVKRHLQFLSTMPNNSRQGRKQSGFVVPVTKGFDTLEAAVTFFYDNSQAMTMVLELRGVNQSDFELPVSLTAILHPFRKESQVWHTGTAHDLVFDRHPRKDFADKGFAYMEELVSRSILTMWLTAASKNTSGADFSLRQKRFPVPAFVSDAMFLTLKLQLTLLMVLSFMMSVFIQTKNVLYEKEFRIKETMRLMGMSLIAFWSSWFCTCFFFMMPVIFLFTLVLKVDFKGDGALLKYSDPTVILVLLFCYGMCVVSYTLMITCIVNKGNEGVIVSGFFFLLEYVPFEIIYQRAHELDRFSKLVSCISFNVAMGLANYNTLRREARSMSLGSVL
ncbi:ATP-binding cassette sub-family a member 3 [Plakobranchus ocellatus]|uniref:ATP-binding cassette sub-family a member 3 n=1 Tax=Plakobranchus ocellatus TaxID=259542 RepID=A0AAV3YHS4_9GAST|nr:ATP-binding cassette sub-family a member 3 [Plakobranchus ocellatus]